MGFGTLFVGYFLLLNITYYSFTDVIAGLVIAIGLYKLSSVNSHFKKAAIPSLVFSFLGFAELLVEAYNMFFERLDLTVYNYIVGPLRYALIALITLFMLYGIEAVCHEVDLPKIQKKSRVLIPFSLSIFLFSSIFELPLLSLWFDTYTVAVIGLLVLTAYLIVVILNLTAVYSSYICICMPSDLKKSPKRSKIEFVNKFRQHEEDKQKEYAEYKLNKRKNKKK